MKKLVFFTFLLASFFSIADDSAYQNCVQACNGNQDCVEGCNHF